MHLPDGSLVADRSATALLAIQHLAFYDLAQGKWIPAARKWVSPDGARYVHGDASNRVHVVDIASGSDRLLLDEAGWGILDYSGGGIYLSRLKALDGGDHYSGLYVLDVNGGRPRQLLSTDVVDFSADGRYGWALTDMTLLSPPRTLVRIDLQTGLTESWYTARYLGAIYTDLSEKPLLLVLGDAARLERFEAKNSPTTIYQQPAASPWPQGPYAVDAHGLWLTTFTSSQPYAASPWLLTRDGKMIRLPAVFPQQIEVAGGCH
jgi:hypothetical protein